MKHLQGHDALWAVPLPNRLYNARLTLDGRRLAAGGDGRSVGVWTVGSAAPPCRLDAPTGTAFLHNLHWNAAGTRLLGFDDLIGVHVWSAETSERLFTCTHILSPEDHEGAFDARWNRDETRLLSASQSDVRLWDGQTGALITAFTAGTYNITARWSANEQLILVGGYNDALTVHDAQTGALLLELDHSSDVLAADWSTDGQTIRLLRSGRSTVKVWDAGTGRLLWALDAAPLPHGAIAVWLGDLVLVHRPKAAPRLALYDGREPRLLSTFEHDGYLFGMLLHDHCVITYGDHVRIHDRRGVCRVVIHERLWVRFAAIQGDRLITCGDDAIVRAWDLNRLLEEVL